MCKGIKQARLRCLNHWITKIIAYGAGQCALSKCDFDFNVEISKLTQKQLQLVNALMSGAYSTGCNDTREHINSLRKQDLKQTAPKFIIQDWTGKVCFEAQTFPSFDDAEEFLCVQLDEHYDLERGEFEITTVGEVKETKFLDPNDPRSGQRKNTK